MSAIYSDDPHAVLKLTAKLDDKLAARAAIAAYNRTCRKGAPDYALLSERWQEYLVGCLRHTAYNCPGGRMPGYVSANLSGEISRLRERLAGLESAA
jgi:hypothetical protein